MSSLYQNAINSIQIGVEDFRMNKQERGLSAVRNLYAGTLLLSKELLCRAAPHLHPDLILAARYEPRFFDDNEVKIVQTGFATIDFQEVCRRLKLFRVPISVEKLKSLEMLQKLRNNIEHRYSSLSHQEVRVELVRVFPLILHLLDLCKEAPGPALGRSYAFMIQETETYKEERKVCLKTLSGIQFPNSVLSAEDLRCGDCESKFVKQTDEKNQDHRAVILSCNLCGFETKAAEMIELALAKKFQFENFKRIVEPDEPLSHGECPYCGLVTYVLDLGCIWCEKKLPDCGKCGLPLNPHSLSTVSSLYCDHCEPPE